MNEKEKNETIEDAVDSLIEFEGLTRGDANDFAWENAAEICRLVQHGSTTSFAATSIFQKVNQ